MTTVDLSIIFLYLAATLAVGIVVGFRQSLESFWVNERGTKALLLGGSIISTQLGAGALIGIASGTFTGGSGLFVVSAISLTLGFGGIAYLAPYIKRFGDKYGAISLAEFFLVRYGRRTQIAAALVVLFVYISFLAAQFVAMGALLDVWTPVAFRWAVIFAAGGVLLYTAYAGLKGDIIVDFLHFVVMVVVFFIILLPSVLTSGEVSGLFQLLREVPPQLKNPSTFGGWPFLVGGIIFSGILPLVSMEIWQRVYSAASAQLARKVFLVSILVVLPAYLSALIFGFRAAVEMPQLQNGDYALYHLMANHLAPGALGLGVAAVLAVFLSTANSMALVVSATFARDILRSKGADFSIGHGRLLTLGFGVVGLIFALTLPNIVQLTLNAFFILGVLFFPFVCGLFWSRATAFAATWSIGLGAVTTLAFLPFLPTQAFVPGAVVAIPTFFLASLKTRHSKEETLDLKRVLRD